MALALFHRNGGRVRLGSADRHVLTMHASVRVLGRRGGHLRRSDEDDDPGLLLERDRHWVRVDLCDITYCYALEGADVLPDEGTELDSAWAWGHVSCRFFGVRPLRICFVTTANVASYD